MAQQVNSTGTPSAIALEEVDFASGIKELLVAGYAPIITTRRSGAMWFESLVSKLEIQQQQQQQQQPSSME